MGGGHAKRATRGRISGKSTRNFGHLATGGCSARRGRRGKCSSPGLLGIPFSPISCSTAKRLRPWWTSCQRRNPKRRVLACSDDEAASDDSTNFLAYVGYGFLSRFFNIVWRKG